MKEFPIVSGNTVRHEDLEEDVIHVWISRDGGHIAAIKTSDKFFFCGGFSKEEAIKRLKSMLAQKL